MGRVRDRLAHHAREIHRARGPDLALGRGSRLETPRLEVRTLLQQRRDCRCQGLRVLQVAGVERQVGRVRELAVFSTMSRWSLASRS